ncbi:hypothetical protein [Natronomonas marina]|uniref:hypothetical protein n=1 Tax=Natronomonas marina TaxID=2961939 RepID=UPI0020C98809|nr:hypothetical protein [Natronomonas marina]
MSSSVVSRVIPPGMALSVPRAVAMTVAEAAAVAVYIVVISSQQGIGGVYTTLAVGGGAVLLVGLFLEDAIALAGTGEWNVWYAVGLAVTEVVVWTQWANVVTGGLWSARGIGPAFVVLATLLVLQHGVENALMGTEPPLRPRHLVTAAVEAMAATVGWVLIVEGALLAGVGALFALFVVEHMIRLTAPPYLDGPSAG